MEYFGFSRLVIYMCFTSPEDNMEKNTLIHTDFSKTTPSPTVKCF